MFRPAWTFLALAAAVLVALPANAAERRQIQTFERVTLAPAPIPTVAKERDWRPYFENLSKGGVLIQTDAKRLTYWGPNGETYMEFPVAVGRAPEFERRGRTSIVRKRTNPDWTPTPEARRRDPSLPAYVPPGPDNPMGQYAMYLGWTYYAIHGTPDPLSVGRAASSGCFRLFPEHAEMLYDQLANGTPVYVE